MVKYDGAHHTLTLNERLRNDLAFMSEYTRREKQEVAGFLIRALHGGLGVVSPVLGKGLEVELDSHEYLHKGEIYLGSFHCHTYTNFPSPHDMATFLADPTERVSMVSGADGSLTLALKTDETQEIGLTEIPRIKDAYEQDELPQLAEQYRFLYYHGKGERLTLTNKVKDRGEEAALDDVIRTIRGEEQLPERSIKKIKKASNPVTGLLDARSWSRFRVGG